MKKKILTALVIVLLTCVTIFCMSACNENKSKDNTDDKLIFTTLTVTDKSVYGTVANSVDKFSFSEEIKLSGNANFIVSLDEDGIQSSTTKSMPLIEGDNTFYILETVNGVWKQTYIVTIHRNYLFTVNFNTEGGTVIASQTIEEGCCATEPNIPTRVGHTFLGWYYDFSLPITNNTTIYAKWRVNQYTLTIVYNNGHDNKVITQDYNASIEKIVKPEKSGYDFVGWDKTIPTKMPAEDITITAIWQSIFTFSDNIITGLTTYGKTLRQIVIPGSIDNEKITSIREEAFYDCKLLTSIIIQDGITSIGENAFRNCSNLTTVEIPNSVTSIGDFAFAGVDYLRCNSKDNLKYLGNETNKYLYLLDTENEYIMTATIDSNCRFIGSSSFYNCISLRNIVIPNSVIIIGTNAFYGCSQLKSIQIPNNVTSIGDWAFSFCTSLTSATIGNSVTNIGVYAFRGCSSLSNILIPNSVTTIGQYAFYECDSLTYNSKDNLRYIGNEKNKYLYLVNTVDKSIKTAEIDSNCRFIGDSAFSRCNLLTSIEIPDSVISIGSYAFSRCYSLSNIVLSDGLIDVGQRAFEDCDDLTSVDIPRTVTRIGSEAFFGCISLKSIVIPNNVTSLSSYTFYNCTSLTSIEISNSVTSIGDDVFYNCNSLTYNEKAGLKYLGNSSNPYLYLASAINTNITSATIDSNCKFIANNAFRNCSLLTSVEIPNSVTIIGNYAFDGCNSLTNVIIGNSVTTIGNYAFSNSSSLEYVEIPNSVTTIGWRAFDGCSNLTNVIIGNNVKSLGNCAFYNCSSLTSIKYRGSSSEWSTISKGLNWDTGAGRYIITYDYIG